MLHHLFFNECQGNVCRVADGLTMLVNLNRRADCPELTSALRTLAAGMLGGSIYDACERLQGAVEDAHALKLSTVTPDGAVGMGGMGHPGPTEMSHGQWPHGVGRSPSQSPSPLHEPGM